MHLFLVASISKTLIQNQIDPMFQRLISRLPVRTRFSGQPHGLNWYPSVKFSNESSKPIPQITQKRDLFSGTSDKFKGPTRVRGNFLPTSLKFTSFIHSTGQNEFDSRINNKPGQVDPERNPRSVDAPNQPSIFTGRNTSFFEDLAKRLTEAERTGTTPTEPTRPPFTQRESGSMNYVRGIMRDNISDMIGGLNPSQNYRSGVEQNADIVHIKILRNNTFVTVTDSKGNKKTGASAGCLAEMKGGPKVSKYSAEATAEHIGRVARSMGVKNVVMKVNGFTFFKRKKLAMLSFRDGYTHSRSDRNPIVYIEDTTRKPHNGCRLKKQRRV